MNLRPKHVAVMLIREVIIITNKELIFKLVKEHCLQNIESSNYMDIGVTTQKISDITGFKRNYASRILNDLSKDRKLIKVNTRPVYFIEKDVVEQKIGKKFNSPIVFSNFTKLQKVIENRNNTADSEKELDKNSEDPFKKFIGFNGSLKYQVEQCKAAIRYPPNGLPILITGPTGSGKSFIAKLMYEYAVNRQILNTDAPFVVFNCAEYANNPELLSANFFGYIKGAFTGAEKDTKGVLEEADGGYLFLDEAHRLPPEGQEKLFLFMDSGAFRRLGESKDVRKSNARFIFATTEKIETFMISTFLRRIPIIIKIPALNKRPLGEKFNLIYNFFKEEALSLNKDLLISRQALKVFAMSDFEANVGQLKNDIKFTCARAYNYFCNIKSDKDPIHINIMNLPEHLVNAAVIESDIDNINSFYNNLLSKDLKIKSSYDASFEIQAIIDREEFNIYRSFYDQILEILKCSKTNSRNTVKLDEVTVLIDEFFDKLILKMNSFSKEDWRNIRFNTIYKCIHDSFKNLKNKYDLKYNDNIVYKIACFVNQSVEYSYFADFADYNNKFKNYIENLKDDFSRYHIVTSKMCDFLNYNLDISINSANFLTLLLYLKGLSKQKDTMRIKAVIVAHGLSTASSIANVANHLLGEYIFEAFDMPIDVEPIEIVKKLKYYLNEVDTSKGIIILVDMGSLEEIYYGLERVSKGVIGIVNNITTQLALDAGCSIIQGLSVEQIVKKATERNRSTYKLIKPTGAKKKALITTCITGIGTAIRIKDLIIKSLGEYSEQIEIIAYDFLALKNNRYDDPIFTDYNVVAIIGTKDPQVNQVPFFSLEDIISGKKEESFSKILASFTSEEGIKQINKSIVKYFSLESVLNNITILNPDKILDHVEIAIEKLQYALKTAFTNDVKICLFIHLSCLIERLVTKTEIEDYDDEYLSEFKKCNQEFINLTKNSFSVIEKSYSVRIPLAEIYFIHEILSSKLNSVAQYTN